MLIARSDRLREQAHIPASIENGRDDPLRAGVVRRAGSKTIGAPNRTHLVAGGVTIDAIELNKDQSEGYWFKVIGHEKGDLFELLARLVTRMRQGLACTHLEEDAYGLQINDRGIVRARIESDADGKTDMPVVVIDGRNISWDEFGRMVATYTGFQFKLELRDLSDDI
ncbi:MAG: hypothetical protein M5U30_19215 [Burkholderiaceae bacterium]|nr:hypothetical protein [Burkholderiaceae bacterium]